MPYLRTRLGALAVMLALAGKADATGPADKDMWFVPPVEYASDSDGETGTQCIALHRVRSTRILAGEGIVYQMSGRKLLINRVRRGASLLNRNQILITRTSGALLCAGDIVQLAESSPGISAGSVALGRFERYHPPARP